MSLWLYQGFLPVSPVPSWTPPCPRRSSKCEGQTAALPIAVLVSPASRLFLVVRPPPLSSQVRDYLLVYTTRPVSAGEELCLGYGPETFAAARRYFRHRGTECQCPRCALLRVRPDLQEIEAEVAAAVRHWRTHRAPPELSPERRAAIRAALEPLPVAQQRPLDWVLQMEGAALASEGRYDGAAAAYARAARILYAAQGASLAWARLQCTAVRYLMVWGRTAPAVQILRDIYRSCYVPFGWPAAEFKAVVYRMVAAPPECELRLRRLIHFAIDEPGMG